LETHVAGALGVHHELLRAVEHSEGEASALAVLERLCLDAVSKKKKVGSAGRVAQHRPGDMWPSEREQARGVLGDNSPPSEPHPPARHAIASHLQLIILLLLIIIPIIPSIPIPVVLLVVKVAVPIPLVGILAAGLAVAHLGRHAAAIVVVVVVVVVTVVVVAVAALRVGARDGRGAGRAGCCGGGGGVGGRMVVVVVRRG